MIYDRAYIRYKVAIKPGAEEHDKLVVQRGFPTDLISSLRIFETLRISQKTKGNLKC